MKIQFYIMNTSEEKLISHFVCQLTEKVFKKNHRIQLQLISKEQLDLYDEQLWNFNSNSYLPHLKDIDAINENTKVPIILTNNPKYQNYKSDIMLSLNSEHIVENNQCQQVLYVIDNSENNLSNARKLYKTYKQRNYHITTHKIQLY